MIRAAIFDLDGTLVDSIIGVLCGGFSENALRDEGALAIYRDPADLLEHYYRSPLAG
ncbi:MAG TPA: hypothetical protein VE031_01285 [Chthoniobacterales bacterium]|nr:hypothetical protein [Chthoniobacterales bacterium]